MSTSEVKYLGYFLGFTTGLIFFILNFVIIPFFEIFVIVVATASVGVLYQKGFKRLAWSFFCVSVFIFILAITPLTNLISDQFSASRPLTHADAIVILEGDPAFIRFIHGVSLFRRGYADNLVFTQDANEDRNRNNEFLYSKVYGVMKLGSDNIYILKDAYNTQTEAERFNVLAKEKGWKRVMIVTSPIHSGRATALFKRYALDVYPMPAQDPNQGAKIANPWGRILMFRELVHEIFALVKHKVFK